VYIFIGLLEKDKDDYYCSRVTPSSSTITITSDWLAQNCYIDTYDMVDGYHNNYYNNRSNEKGEEKGRKYSSLSLSSCYCEVCRQLKLDYHKYYCYTDKGKNRQIITICTECFRRYQEKRYELFGKPAGVIAISVISRGERLIIYALRLALANNREIKRNTRRNISNCGSSSVSSATAAMQDNVDTHLNPEYDNDDNSISFFYAAATNAFDHSETVREYFHHDRSRIRPSNKSLWPLRYRAYKEYGVW
jgi:hypothetical protein